MQILWQGGRRFLNTAAAAALCFYMAACAAPSTAPSVTPAPPPLAQDPLIDGPQITDDIRVAAILPLSGPQSRLGEAMALAIQMAFFEAQDPRLQLKFFDTLGSDASDETRAALVDQLAQYAPQAVIGPLFSQAAQAIAGPMLAQGVPVLSFSNDMAANAAGAILLGQQPEQEVARVLAFIAGETETRRLGLIVPDDVYGARVRAAMLATVDALNDVVLEDREALLYERVGSEMLERARVLTPFDAVPETPIMPMFGTEQDFSAAQEIAVEEDDVASLEPLTFYEVTAQQTYPRDLRSLDGPVRRVTQFDTRVAEVEAERAFLTELNDPMGLDYLDSIRNLDTFRQPHYDILLVGEGGQLLRALAPLLTVYAIDEEETQLIGTGLWNDPALTREPALHGGLFAAAPADVTRNFTRRYMDQYDARPPALAASAFDAMAILALAARTDGGDPAIFQPSRLFQSAGFRGASGLFRILPSGITERTLAVMKITASGLETVDEAPDAFPLSEPLPEEEKPADPVSR